MNKSIVFKVYLEPIEVELHNEVGDERTARDEALSKIVILPAALSFT